jgi:hypothetical protein
MQHVVHRNPLIPKRCVVPTTASHFLLRRVFQRGEYLVATATFISSVKAASLTKTVTNPDRVFQ